MASLRIRRYLRKDGAAGEPDPLDIHARHQVPFLDADFIERGTAHGHGGEHRGVIDQDVDAAEPV